MVRVTLRKGLRVEEIAHALSGRPGLSVVTGNSEGMLRREDARFSYIASDPSEASSALVPPPRRLVPGEVPEWIGGIPYDAPSENGTVAPQWLRYPACVRVDHATGVVSVEGESKHAVETLAAAIHRGKPRTYAVELAYEEEASLHEERIRRVQELIRAGDVYLVNVARRFRFRVSGDYLSLFFELSRRTAAPYCFFQSQPGQTVITTSPELALQVRGRRLRTGPVKGTRPRGADRTSDLHAEEELEKSSDERAQLAMTLDVHRNDLAMVSEVGSVRVTEPGRVLRGKTVMNRVGEVVSYARDGVSMEDVVRAMLPAGSVTGAPKRRAMVRIQELEGGPRGIYAGVVGVCSFERLNLAMAIRTLIVGEEGEGTYLAGGGIVLGSDPEREVSETRWKAVQLLSGESGGKVAREKHPGVPKEELDEFV